MTDEITSRVVGGLGHIKLNRPKALNALTFAMCEEIARLLVAWEQDPNVGAVLIDGAGDRAFCAGGDIILLHDSGKAGDDRAEAFWRIEYSLNELIHRYSKPYIALIDGIVMGGGVGLSVHGRYRIAGGKTLFAMPETGIGYFPDLGGSYFLPRLGKEIGRWLGLTGARLDGGQSMALGVANAYVETENHADLIEALGLAELDGSEAAVDKVLAQFATSAPQTALIPDAINAFAAPNVEAIIQTLDADASEWADAQAAILRKKSPYALSVTDEALRLGAKMDFRAAMTQELDISLNFLKTPDFYEGIRAQVIDKDRNPRWLHETVGAVTDDQVSKMFETAAIPPQKFL